MRLTVLCVSVVLALVPAAALAMPSCSVTFSENDLSFTKYEHDDDTFDVVGLKGAGQLLEPPGFPSLPVVRLYILIPQDRRCTSVNITYLDSASLAGNYSVFPCQLPALTNGDPPPPFTEPDSVAYNSASFYPNSLAGLVAEGFNSGYKLAEIEVHPVRYVAGERRLVFCSRVDVSLTLDQCENQARQVCRRSELSQQHIEDVVRAMVANPEDVDGYGLGAGFHVQGPASPGELLVTELPSVEGQCVDYLVITSEELASAFQPILDWRTRRGAVAALRTVDWIDANYPGCDIQERIRNFIVDAYSHWGTIWVLLGGDEDVVPVRWTLPGQTEPADLYYADLQGNWNRLPNAYFGDVWEDLEDRTFTADIGLGRLPVWNAVQVTAFWNKLQGYEKHPDPDPNYILGILMAGGSSAGDNGAGAKDKDNGVSVGLQAQPWFPQCGFQRVYELYGPQRDPYNDPPEWEGQEELSSQSFTDQFNAGYQFINHADHSSPTTLGTWQASRRPGNIFTKDQAALLWNGEGPNGSPRCSILWTYGCSPGALDHASIGQTLVNNPVGGCVAFIGNSRPGAWDGQERQDREFYRALFIEHLSHVGTAFRLSQPMGLGTWQTAFTYAKRMNLYGDPEMPVWTEELHSMVAVYPSAIPLGPQTFEVEVTENGNPVPAAIVTVYKQVAPSQVELYAWRKTMPDGSATFSDLCPESPGAMQVTVTKQNYLPIEGVCNVQTGIYAYVHYKGCAAVDDDEQGASYGNDDGVVNPGEHIELTIQLENTGLIPATDVSATLTTQDRYVQIQQAQASFGDIVPGGTATNGTPFVFSVAQVRPGVPPEITFSIATTSPQGSWTDDFRIMVMRDSLVLGGHRVTEVPPGSGSFAMDSLVATNYGWGAAAGVTAELTSNNTSYVVDDGLCAFDDIAGQSTGIGTDQFTYHYTGIPGDPDFNLELGDRYGRTWGRQVDLVPPSGTSLTPWLILAGDNYLTLGWGLSHAPDLRGYNVYRRQGTTGDFHLANTLLVDSSATFRDEGLSPYTVYQYKVSAVDYSGNESDLSAELQVMTTPTYQSGWPVHAASGHEQRTSGVCGNIIGDDRLEVVATMGDSIYAWHSDGQRVAGWPKGLGIIPSCAPALADLDGDGYDEVMFGVSDGQGLFAWNGDGSNVPGWPADVPFTGSVTVADIDQDGSLEVIGATADHYLNVWSASGSLVRRWRVLDDEGFECTVHGSPAVADLDASSTGAGDLEIVVIAKAAPGAPDPDRPVVLAYRNDGTRMWAHGVPDAARTWGADCNSPVIADLDEDGAPEIVAAVSGSDANDIHVLSHDGQFLDDLGDIGVCGTWGCPAIGDIDGDGLPEIVLTAAGSVGGTNHTCVAAWRFTGGLCAFIDSFDLRKGYFSHNFRTGPAIADVNGDGQMEVVTGFWDGEVWNDRVRAFRLAGGQFQEMLTDGFPIYGVDLPYQEFVVTDLDIDGDLELLAFMCEQGVVHAWDFPVPYDRRKVEWGSFHGDVRHTGLYAQPIWGNVAHDMYWWGRYKLFGNLVLTDYDLAVRPGTWVQARRRLSTVTSIMVNSGTFTATGTRAARTYFEAELAGDAWDGIRVSNGSASVTGCNIADATEGLAAMDLRLPAGRRRHILQLPNRRHN